MHGESKCAVGTCCSSRRALVMHAGTLHMCPSFKPTPPIFQLASRESFVAPMLLMLPPALLLLLMMIMMMMLLHDDDALLVVIAHHFWILPLQFYVGSLHPSIQPSIHLFQAAGHNGWSTRLACGLIIVVSGPGYLFWPGSPQDCDATDPL